MAETVLIVDRDPVSRRRMVELLKGRYRTIRADGFALAARLLISTRPDLLITTVRLGAFNGLHLVLRSRKLDPRIAALVIDDSPDPVLEQECNKVGGIVYLAKSIAPDELLKCVADALAARERRSWRRTTLLRDVEVRIANRRARLLDVSDGGFRLESGWPLPAGFRLELPTISLAVNAERVWSRRAEVPKVWLFGAALAPRDPENLERWLRLVSRFRAQTSTSS